ncbi:hypothetical protein V8B55DRAFT_1574955 [Mucor lusitanicus]
MPTTLPPHIFMHFALQSCPYTFSYEFCCNITPITLSLAFCYVIFLPSSSCPLFCCVFCLSSSSVSSFRFVLSS